MAPLLRLLPVAAAFLPLATALAPRAAPYHPPRTARAAPLRPAPSPCMSLPTAAYLAAATVTGGALGTPFVVGAIRTWYRRIPLPGWTPPDRVFAPVWSSLYAAMGVATAIVGGARGFASPPVVHFAAHYAANLAWAPVFFGLRRLRLALALNLALCASLALLVAQYSRASAAAGLLLLPYLAWVLFATALNVAICRLNPTEGGYNNAMLQAELAQLQRRASAIAFGA
ncbi:hypothetical protein AB1Y20_013456 [Prymnesium parvum]|uniref:Uncharacterized protein n=1 Tax=Prymnesium parvum TaxID=97485 RepID=A0AB34IHV9_PRYPA